MRTQKGFVLPIVVAILVLGVGGYFLLTNNKFSNKNQNNPNNSNSSAKTNEVSHLKKYINSEFKFELKYPENYEVKESRQYASFDGTKQFVLVNFVYGKNNLSLEINNDNGRGIGVCRPKVDTVKITNPFGVQIEKKKFTEYIPEKNGQGYSCEKVDKITFLYYFGGPFPRDSFTVSGTMVDDNNGLKLEKMADLIVQNFEFISSTSSEKVLNSQTSSWQTYSNSIYGFSFMYPTGITVKEKVMPIASTNCVQSHTYQEVVKECPDAGTEGGINLLIEPTNAIFEIRKNGYSNDDDGIGYSPRLTIKTENLNSNSISIEKTVNTPHPDQCVGDCNKISFIRYQFSLNGYNYTINLLDPTQEKQFDQIVYTFKSIK